MSKYLWSTVFFAALLIQAQAWAGSASDATGKFGIGYTYGNAPLGIRMWFQQNMAFDANLGFILRGEEDKPETADPNDTQTTADWALDLGFLYAFAIKDNSKFYGRIGLNIDRDYAVGHNDSHEAIDSSVLTTTFDLSAGFEFYLDAFGFPELALQAAAGIAYQSINGPEQAGDDDKDWSFQSLTSGANIVATTMLGFHYYF